MTETHVSLINVGDLSKPANTLIEKISEAIGGYCKPFQIRRTAHAEADADKIHAVAQIEITELQHRAMSRLLAEEAKKQHNIEAITLKALPDLNPEAKPENVEDDWITNFFDECRSISDEEMQSLWAKLLAGEANSPGKFSRRTVNIVGSLDKIDAHLFSQVCGFNLYFGELCPIIIDYQMIEYQRAGLTFDNLSRLEHAGLIRLTGGNETFAKMFLHKKFAVGYFADRFSVEFTSGMQEPNKQAPVYSMRTGQVMFTKAGEELSSLAGAQPQDGFIHLLTEYWKKFGIKFEPMSPPVWQGNPESPPA